MDCSPAPNMENKAWRRPLNAELFTEGEWRMCYRTAYRGADCSCERPEEEGMTAGLLTAGDPPSQGASSKLQMKPEGRSVVQRHLGLGLESPPSGCTASLHITTPPSPHQAVLVGESLAEEDSAGRPGSRKWAALCPWPPLHVAKSLTPPSTLAIRNTCFSDVKILLWRMFRNLKFLVCQNSVVFHGWLLFKTTQSHNDLLLAKVPGRLRKPLVLKPPRLPSKAAAVVALCSSLSGHWLPKPDVISLLEQEAELWAADKGGPRGVCPDLETRPQSKLSTENQGVTEEIPNSALVERFLQESLWHSKDEDAAGHREQGPEKSDSCVVQAACTLVKTLTEEQQQGDGCGENLSLRPDLPTQPMTPERQGAPMKINLPQSPFQKSPLRGNRNRPCRSHGPLPTVPGRLLPAGRGTGSFSMIGRSFFKIVESKFHRSPVNNFQDN
ncbi:hypothetical protein E5288_WYG007435 [Bos mutus]|uniref:Uncharacterized protein n=1 Tax=Bos mutus TaxID=72004 RepID=A0A6B0SAF9_9CETA|nr:hypothetical protein [Bos mutus]